MQRFSKLPVGVADAKDADQETSNVGGKARFKRIAHRYKDVVKNENEVSSAKSSTEL